MVSFVRVGLLTARPQGTARMHAAFGEPPRVTDNRTDLQWMCSDAKPHSFISCRLNLLLA